MILGDSRSIISFRYKIMKKKKAQLKSSKNAATNGIV